MATEVQNKEMVHIGMTKQQMAVLLVLLDSGNTKSGYWKGSDWPNLPIILLENGVTTAEQAGTIADQVQTNLKAYIL